MKNILITGGAGFIGSNFIKLLLEERDYNVFNLDLMSYAGNPDNLLPFVDFGNYKFYKGDIADFKLVSEIMYKEEIDSIINFAAESHVDRSIQNSYPFMHSNVEGTLNLLNIAKQFKLTKFLQISTDEVYGSASSGETFDENSNLQPNSPYSSSKASADLFVRSYYKTHSVPAIITRSSNNFGPNQYPEKLIPLVITNALEGKKIPVYGTGENIRNWIYVEDNCRAILECFEKGKEGEIYNIASGNELDNLTLIKSILRIIGKSEDLIEFVEDRLGHDLRYSINSDKIRNSFNWDEKYNFHPALEKTINWYLENKIWLQNLKERTNFSEFYKTLYRVD
ncbi:MAG: dTDP-glucose 4,6-dehydratase [Ignavibacteria bacterium GWF2_33_9]|nr:MAG: dTDP-glucose 4,6-dehydratase [Ignavibacteria bacterium GWF2_33_9]